MSLSKKPDGAAAVNIGGLAGAQRYQCAENNTVKTDITTKCELNADSGFLNVGAVAGTLDVFYTTQILLFSAESTAGCAGNQKDAAWNGAFLTDNFGSLPCGDDGQPLEYICKGTYTTAEGEELISNIETVTGKYGSYIPYFFLQDGIVWIIND